MSRNSWMSRRGRHCGMWNGKNHKCQAWAGDRCDAAVRNVRKSDKVDGCYRIDHGAFLNTLKTISSVDTYWSNCKLI